MNKNIENNTNAIIETKVHQTKTEDENREDCIPINKSNRPENNYFP